MHVLSRGDVPTRDKSCGTVLSRKILSLSFAGGQKPVKIFSICAGDKIFSHLWGTKTCKIFVNFVR